MYLDILADALTSGRLFIALAGNEAEQALVGISRMPAFRKWSLSDGSLITAPESSKSSSFFLWAQYAKDTARTV